MFTVIAGNQRSKCRALLQLGYNRCIHDDYAEAKNLLQTPNVQEIAMNTDVATQILYNRNFVQLGLCAFRQGYIQEAYNCLTEICASYRHRELLAQVPEQVHPSRE